MVEIQAPEVAETISSAPEGGSGVEVCVEAVRHDFGGVTALQEVSLTAQRGEFLSLLGPSGSGKTTLLRIVAGLVKPTGGRVLIAGRDMTRVPANKRNVGFVFQNYALFPHMTVFENVAFGLSARKVGREAIREQVRQALELVSLSGLENRFPANLSGGQQQRVSLARAVVFEPSVLLMDEPLGSLDKRLRQGLQGELRRLQRRLGITTIYVTHDQEEAFFMSDRIAVMNEGTIRQIDRPQRVYLEPAEPFVASFVGDFNRFDGKVVGLSEDECVVRTDDGLDLRGLRRESDSIAEGMEVVCGVRPERLRVGSEIADGNRCSAVVEMIVFQGNMHRVELKSSSGHRLIAEVGQWDFDIRESDATWVAWSVADTIILKPDV